jgi:succinylarginine dihydrolase
MKKVINQAAKQNPALLKNVYSASSMWAANAATFSPSIDSYDQNIHITPANLNSMFHRSIEHEFTKTQLELMFGGSCSGALNQLKIFQVMVTRALQIT